MTTADRFRALVEAATPGEWHVRRNDEGNGDIHYDVDDADEREVACVRHALPHDARLIVALVKIAPEMVEWYRHESREWELGDVARRAHRSDEGNALFDAITRSVGEEK